MAQDHCTSMEEENSGSTIVKGTLYLVLNFPPLVLHSIGTIFLVCLSPSGTNFFLINVLLQPVSISTRVSFTGADPVTFLINAVTSVVKSDTLVSSTLRSFLLIGDCT